MERDPTTTDPDAHRVLFENDRVRLLEYHDTRGYRTKPPSHPDSVMYTLASFSRKLGGGGKEVDVELTAGTVRWVGAQEGEALIVTKLWTEDDDEAVRQIEASLG